MLVVDSVYATNKSISYAIFTLNPNMEGLSTSKARLLYRGSIKTLKGKRVELCDWSNNNAVRSEFYRLLLGKDQAQMTAHWASISFSGKARPPKQLPMDSIDSLIQWLAEKPSRIGYAPVNVLPQNANVLYIVKGSEEL